MQNQKVPYKVEGGEDEFARDILKVSKFACAMPGQHLVALQAGVASAMDMYGAERAQARRAELGVERDGLRQNVSSFLLLMSMAFLG